MNSTLAVLVGELIAAGVDVMAIMAKADASGNVPPNVWAEVEAEVKRANARWEAAGDPDGSPGKP